MYVCANTKGRAGLHVEVSIRIKSYLFTTLQTRVCTNVHAYECMCVQFATRAPTPAPFPPPLYTHVRYRRIHTGHASNSVLNTTSLTQRTADAAVGCAGAARLAIDGACD